MEQYDDNGIIYELETGDNATGYKCVVMTRPGQYHAKVTLERGGGQTMLPGPACATPQEAALRYAKYLTDRQPITKKERAKKGEGKVRRLALRQCSARLTPALPFCNAAEAQGRGGRGGGARPVEGLARLGRLQQLVRAVAGGHAEPASRPAV